MYWSYGEGEVSLGRGWVEELSYLMSKSTLRASTKRSMDVRLPLKIGR